MYGNHANLIIYRRDKNRLEHYEPNGNFNGNFGHYINNTVKKLVDVLKTMIPDFEFVPSWKLHRCVSCNDCNGLQSYTNNGHKDRGTCQLWCYLIVELILKYPQMTSEDIIDNLDYDKNLTRSKLGRHVKEIIRGYYFQSMKDISNLLIEGGSDIYIYSGIDLVGNIELQSNLLTFIDSQIQNALS